MQTIVCFITAVYERTITECKPFVEQSVPTDFICFSNNTDIINNGWKIDNTPYHKDISHDHRVISKYYKMMTHDILILRKYAVIIWIDNNIEIISKKISEYVLKKLYRHSFVCWHHPAHFGDLYAEVHASHRLLKYSYDIKKQYQEYLADGYHNIHFKSLCHSSPHFGVWYTAFIAYNNKDTLVHKFLREWFTEILRHGTNDMVSFSYVCYKHNTFPYTLPDNQIYGEPNTSNEFYLYHD